MFLAFLFFDLATVDSPARGHVAARALSPRFRDWRHYSLSVRLEAQCRARAVSPNLATIIAKPQGINASARTGPTLLRRGRSLLAHFGSVVTSDLSPECALKRTSVDGSYSHMKSFARRARFSVVGSVHSHSKKYFRSVFSQIISMSTPVSSQRRGVSRSSRTRDEMRWTRAASGVRQGRRADCSP